MESTRGVSQRDGHKALRVDSFEAIEQMFPPHAWIDQDDDRARLKQSERQRDEVNSRPDQQN